MSARNASLAALLPALVAFTVSPTLGSVEAAPPSQDPLEQAWSDATLHLFKESSAAFEKAEGREARLGRAALLLLQQPKTEANLDAAVRELDALSSGDPRDDVAASALYLLGRVAHVHRATPDLALAASRYRRLLEEHPDHVLADQALIKLALIELYDPALAGDGRASRVDALADRADKLSRPASRRDLHLVLADAVRHFELGDERMLRHYLAADAAGAARPTLRANITVAVGELAARLGRADLARTYFERFLGEFKRDYRRTLVRDKLAALPSPGTAPSPAR